MSEPTKEQVERLEDALYEGWYFGEREYEALRALLEAYEELKREAEARLREMVEALKDTANYQKDAELCWCYESHITDGAHADYCLKARAALAAAQPEEPGPQKFKHRPGCLADGESALDYDIRMVNLGPCECEIAAARFKKEKP